MAEWAVEIRRFDIRYNFPSLNRFYAAPWEGHLTRFVKIFGYLQNVYGNRKSIFVSPDDIGEIRSKGDNNKDWLEKYPGATEEIDEGLPEPWGRPLSTLVYFDSDHTHDQLTRQSVTGVLSFVGLTHISCTIKRQGTIESSSYSAEFCAGRVASE